MSTIRMDSYDVCDCDINLFTFYMTKAEFDRLASFFVLHVGFPFPSEDVPVSYFLAHKVNIYEDSEPIYHVAIPCRDFELGDGLDIGYAACIIEGVFDRSIRCVEFFEDASVEGFPVIYYEPD